MAEEEKKTGSPKDKLLATARELLSYSPETGVFVWLVRVSNVKAGAVAGRVRNGYRVIRLRKREYYAHRLAWFWMTGEWPGSDIDHINGEKDDNRWGNLRVVSKLLNQQNQRKAHKINKTGLMGAHFSQGVFRSRIKVNGKEKSLGTFSTAEKAHEAYIKAKRVLHAGCTI